MNGQLRSSTYFKVLATVYILGQVAIGSDFSGLALRWLHDICLWSISVEVVFLMCVRENGTKLEISK